MPSRGDVNDIANSICDGADGIMITSEVSNSNNCISVVKQAKRIAIWSESSIYYKQVN